MPLHLSTTRDCCQETSCYCVGKEVGLTKVLAMATETLEFLFWVLVVYPQLQGIFRVWDVSADWLLAVTQCYACISTLLVPRRKQTLKPYIPNPSCPKHTGAAAFDPCMMRVFAVLHVERSGTLQLLSVGGSCHRLL